MFITKYHHGALTSKPYAFKARPWELRNVDYVDFLDAQGSNIRVDIRDEQILRILPRTNYSINEEWITDRIRFAHDGLKNQRLTTCLVRIHNKLLVKPLNQLIDSLTLGIFTKNAVNFVGYLGSNLDLLKNVLLKDFFNANGANPPKFPTNRILQNVDFRPNYICNTPFTKVEEADLCLLVGTNLRLEAPILNLKLRRLKTVDENLKIFLIGPAINLTYEYEHLGLNTTPLTQFFRGKHLLLNKVFPKALKPLVIVGDLLNKSQMNAIAIFLSQNLPLLSNNLINSKWNGLNFVSPTSGNINSMEIANVQKKKETYTKMPYYEMNCSMFFAFDEFNSNIKKTKHDLFTYLGSHGDNAVNIADFIIPIPSPVETTNIFTSLQGAYNYTPQIFNFNTIKIFSPTYISINETIKKIKLVSDNALQPFIRWSTSQLSTNRQLNLMRETWILRKFRLFAVLSNILKNTMTKYNLRVCQLIPRIKVKYYTEPNALHISLRLKNFEFNTDNYPEFCITNEVSFQNQPKTINYNKFKIYPVLELVSTSIDNYYRQDSISRASPTRNIGQKRLLVNSNF